MIALAVSNKFNIVLYENPMNPHSWKLKDIDVSTESVTQIVPSGNNYCSYIQSTYYNTPSIKIHNNKTGQTDTYRFNSDKLSTRIVIGAVLIHDEEGMSDININVADMGVDCSHTTWYGTVVLTDNGDLYPITIPAQETRNDVFMYVNNHKEKIYIPLVQSKITQSWSGEYNGDRKSDIFFAEPNPASDSGSIVYMWEVKANRFAPWFNNGEPVYHSASVEEINNNWTTQRAFINSHISQ